MSAEVSDGAGEKSREEREAGAETSHGEAEDNDAEGDVGGEMREIGVEKNGGEEAPPLAIVNFEAVHHAAIFDERELIDGEGMNEREDDAKNDGAPVKFEVGAWKFFAPGPAAIFSAIEANGVAGACEVLRRNEKKPAPFAIGSAIDDGFDALAGENEGPVHGLAARIGDDFGRCRERFWRNWSHILGDN